MRKHDALPALLDDFDRRILRRPPAANNGNSLRRAGRLPMNPGLWWWRAMQVGMPRSSGKEEPKHLTKGASRNDAGRSSLVLERECDACAERRDLSVLQLHVHFGDFGHA